MRDRIFAWLSSRAMFAVLVTLFAVATLFEPPHSMRVRIPAAWRSVAVATCIAHAEALGLLLVVALLVGARRRP